MPDLPPTRQELDDRLAQRFIALDPLGYFLIRLDRDTQELVAEHYGNGIDERGLATDPDTGEVLSCRGAGPRVPIAVYRARSAKQLGIALTEGPGPHPLSRLDHALYLGRELQRAEACMEQGLSGGSAERPPKRRKPPSSRVRPPPCRCLCGCRTRCAGIYRSSPQF